MPLRALLWDNAYELGAAFSVLTAVLGHFDNPYAWATFTLAIVFIFIPTVAALYRGRRTRQDRQHVAQQLAYSN